MLRSNSIKKVICYPLLASLVVVLLVHSTIDQRLKNQSQKTLVPAQLFAQTDNIKLVQASQSTSILDANKALELVQNLPQVRRKGREIQRLSRGTIRVASVVDSSPTADEPYYVVRVFENHSNQTTSTIYWFRVLSPNGEIQALDIVENQYIPVEKWNPDAR
ncbi:MAG: hypothetical protein ACKO3K_20800 [Cuspidothrix sp.]